MANSCFIYLFILYSGCNGPGPKTRHHSCVCSLARNTRSYEKGISPCKLFKLPMLDLVNSGEQESRKMLFIPVKLFLALSLFLPQLKESEGVLF